MRNHLAGSIQTGCFPFLLQNIRKKLPAAGSVGITGGNHMVKINGESVDAAGQTLSEYLASTACNPSRIVIEYNEKILPKELHETTVLADGDRVEIISFMGGG